jgi:signal transduction histidine kinase
MLGISFYILITIVVILILLGLLVVVKNPKNKINIYFSSLTLSLAAWIVITYFEDIVSIHTAKILVKFDFAFSIIAATLFALVCLNFPKKMNDKMKDYYLLIVSLPLLALSFTPFIVSNLIKPSQYGVKYVLGSLYYLLIGYICILLVGGALSLYLKYRKHKGLVKSQIQFVLLGGGVTGFFLLLFFAILPNIYSLTPEVTRFGIYSCVFFIGFFSYAIVMHKLMDIKLVVARSVTYLVLLVTLAAIYAGSVLGLERAFFPEQAGDFNLTLGAIRTTIAVVMVFLFQPLKAWITIVTDRIFFKNQYDPEELLSNLSHTISSTILLIEMLYKVNDLLVNNMKLSRAAFVLFKNKDEAYTSQAIGYKGWPPVDVPDFIRMANKGILIYDELEETSTYKKLLRKYDAAILVPIKADNELIGVFLGGEKNSGDMLNQQDIQIFEILAPEVAVGIENAESYEEISKFNVTLRQEIKRATSRLKEKNEQLKELDKAKHEFISMASHQLRTPLTAIKGYLSMLLEGDAGEIKVSQYDFINEANSAAGRMVGLINDLLNVSRMETGRFFLEPKEVDIERIVGEEVKQLQNHAREKGIYLKIQPKGKVPHIWADETKIRQVVMNFIDNAIYYTQKGGVTVKLGKEKDDFVFRVEDTGIGVPKVQKEHLFEKFFRADNARQTRPDGTGLGIYLAKRVVEDHGGKIMFDSEEGKGSMFGFKFPLKTKAQMKAASAPMPNHPAAPALTSASTMLSEGKDTKEDKPKTPVLTSAAATFSEKAEGIEPPIATHPE